VAGSGYHFVLEDGPDLSDSSDDSNVPDEEPNMYAPGCLQGDAALNGLEGFLLRKAGPKTSSRKTSEEFLRGHPGRE
jgi:hypothetical protein